MSTHRQFIFESYKFEHAVKTLTLKYSIDDALHFTETYHFDFDFADNYSQEALARTCELLFLVAGVSYYKTYLPPEIIVHNARIDTDIKKFLDTTYRRGLGELFYVNKLDPSTPVNFPVTSDTLDTNNTPSSGLLIGIGGGKDSIVTAEMLKTQPKVATWSLNHKTQLQPLVERIGLPHYYVERTWDKQLLDLNKQDAYNGHVPISAIFACVGSIVCVLTGYQDNMVSNESSASEPNLTYRGVEINHQYSKSLQFEQSFQNVLQHFIGDTVRYYSFLRPLSELYIAELFAHTGFDAYQDVFSSCNRAFTHDSNHIFWDGTCPKCAFVFLALTPFVARESLESLFGKNMLLDPEMTATYNQLLGIDGDKPLECVGEIRESRTAMQLAQTQYPELQSYVFDLPDTYDYKQLSQHAMPDDLYQLLLSSL